MAYISPAYFGYYYLDRNAPQHHIEIYQALNPPDKLGTKRKTLLLEPRNHGKTTAVMEVGATWIICTNGGGYYPNPRILMIGETKEMAIKRLAQVKGHLENNPKILRDYGNLQGEKWLQSMIYCKRTKPYRDPTLEAVGVGGAVTGGHFTHVLIDDPISKQNSKTEHLRELTSTWFNSTVQPLLNPNGVMVLIGTRKHFQDLYYEVIKKVAERGAKWDIICKNAILDEKTQTVLWPERMTYQALMDEKADIGPSAFASEYMNSPVPPEGLHFKASWLKWVPDEMIPKPPNITYHTWWDPAFGTSDIACNNAIAVFGVTPDNRLYLVDMVRFKGDLDMSFAQLLLVYETWKPKYMYAESNFMQKVIIDAMRKVAMLPLISVDQHKDKIARIQSMEPYYASGRIIHRDCPQIRSWVVEEYLPFFSKGVLVDGMDAASSCIEQIQSRTDLRALSLF